MTKFIPGKTLVHVAGQCFDDKERMSLVKLAWDGAGGVDKEPSISLQLTAGKNHAALERDLAKRFQVKHAILVNSGSSANLLAFETMCERYHIPRGARILTVACAFPTTVAPIVQAGMIPVFVDVGVDGNVDVDQMEAALNLAAQGINPIRGVVLAHALGFPFDVDTVRALCKRLDIPLLADCCDAAGATWGGKQVTACANVSTLSFYPAHHMTTGEGGCVLTDDNEIAKIVRCLRDWGRDCTCDPGHDNTCGKRFKQPQEVLGSLPEGYDHKYVYSRFGYNMKMTEPQAAIGRVQLAKLDEFIDRRLETWHYYADEIDWLGLDAGIWLLSNPPSQPSPFGFLMLSPDRDRIVRELEKRRIQTRPLFAGNLLRHPAMRNVPCEIAAAGKSTLRVDGEEFSRWANYLPVTEQLMREAFWIGVYPGVTDDMREYVAESIEGIVRG